VCLFSLYILQSVNIQPRRVFCPKNSKDQRTRGADAARSEARLSKFRSRAEGEDTQPNGRRIAELARPKRFSDENPKNHKTRSPLKATERKPKSAGYSARTHAEVMRLIDEEMVKRDSEGVAEAAAVLSQSDL